MMEKAFDYLANQLTALEASIVDPERFGALTEKVESLRRDLESQNKILESHMKKTDEALAKIQDLLSEAKGGWRVMMAVGGAAATIGGAVSWVAAHVKLSP